MPLPSNLFCFFKLIHLKCRLLKNMCTTAVLYTEPNPMDCCNSYSTAPLQVKRHVLRLESSQYDDRLGAIQALRAYAQRGHQVDVGTQATGNGLHPPARCGSLPSPARSTCDAIASVYLDFHLTLNTFSSDSRSLSPLPPLPPPPLPLPRPPSLASI